MVITFCVASDVPTADVEAVLIRTTMTSCWASRSSLSSMSASTGKLPRSAGVFGNTPIRTNSTYVALSLLINRATSCFT